MKNPFRDAPGRGKKPPAAGPTPAAGSHEVAAVAELERDSLAISAYVTGRK